jgi:hypothetical protein
MTFQYKRAIICRVTTHRAKFFASRFHCINICTELPFLNVYTDHPCFLTIAKAKGVEVTVIKIFVYRTLGFYQKLCYRLCRHLAWHRSESDRTRKHVVLWRKPKTLSFKPWGNMFAWWHRPVAALLPSLKVTNLPPNTTVELKCAFNPATSRNIFVGCVSSPKLGSTMVNA